MSEKVTAEMFERHLVNGDYHDTNSQHTMAMLRLLGRVGCEIRDIAEAIRQSKGEAKSGEREFDLTMEQRMLVYDFAQRLSEEPKPGDHDLRIPRPADPEKYEKWLRDPQPAEGVERPGELHVDGVMYAYDAINRRLVIKCGDTHDLWQAMDSIAQIHTYTGQILAYAKRRGEGK